MLVHMIVRVNEFQWNHEAEIRCGKVIDLPSPRRERLADLGLTGWASRVSCPECVAFYGRAAA